MSLLHSGRLFFERLHAIPPWQAERRHPHPESDMPSIRALAPIEVARSCWHEEIEATAAFRAVLPPSI